MTDDVLETVAETVMLFRKFQPKKTLKKQFSSQIQIKPCTHTHTLPLSDRVLASE